MKKHKKKKMSKENKTIIICIVLFLGLLITTIILISLSNKANKPQNNNLEIDLNQKLATIEDVTNYFDATYYSEKVSTEDGYDIDVYLSFPYQLYEEKKSKESYFKNFYEKIAIVCEFKSFRLIDENKSINISVKCSETGISEVLINGETEYFKKHDSKNSIENELKVKNINLKTNSQILIDLINAKWNAKNVKLGTQESTYNKYQIYFDEGYEIRIVNGKVFNIVFNSKYKDQVVDGYKVGTDLKEIEDKLGKSYTEQAILGYRTANYYIYFTKDEISIYPNYKFEDYDSFEKLLKEYGEKQDINEFLYELTDIWPDYDKYEYDTNYVEIWYTLKGVKISYNSVNPEGIQIYENYKGNLKTELPEFKNVYYKMDENLIMEKEKLRQMSTGMYDDSIKNENPILWSNKFIFRGDYKENSYRNVKIESIDNQYPNNEFDDTIQVYKYVWADDSHLIYSIQRKGIYVYNAETRETYTLIEGEDEYNITNFDRNTKTIEYDEKQAHVEY